MRVEPYGVGSFLHVVKRGARGMPFMTDQHDRLRFLQMLAHFNDEAARENWIDDLEREDKSNTFTRATAWDEKLPLTAIHAFCIHDNHFHLLLEEIREGGVTAFMRKLGTGFVGYLNARHAEHGSPFQGSYKSRTVDDDAYLRYLFAYIQIKNTFELLPTGYVSASSHFDVSYKKACVLPHSSLYDHEFGGGDDRGIVTKELFHDLWTPRQWRAYTKDVISGRSHLISRLVDEEKRRLTRGYFV